MHTRYQGPNYQMIERVQDTYIIQDLVIGKVHETHISNLTPFNYDPERQKPQEVAIITRKCL